MGSAAANVQIAIMAENGRELPWGEQGEIAYRSPQVFAGYLDNPAATAESSRNGWFHSGDAGYFDKDGVLWFTDRFKDVIKSGGENVSSLEVERAIFEASASIAEVCVVGLPHAQWIEAITAFVVAKPGQEIDSGKLEQDLRERLSRFKTPKAIIVVESLPKTATGKVRKVELRQGFAGYYDQGGRDGD